MTKEPLWRVVLNYGCVVYFLGLPAVVLIGAFIHWRFDSEAAAKFLTEFHFAVTALVATMAGLNTFDRYKGSNGHIPKDDASKKTAVDKQLMS